MRSKVEVMSEPASGLKKYFIVISLIFLSSPVFLPVLYALDNIKSNHIALPRAETSDIIEAWMKQKGYEITKEENRDITLIMASGKKGDIQVRIVTDSPMASVVTIKPLKESNKDPAELLDYLAVYLDKLKVKKISREYDNPAGTDTGAVNPDNSDSVVCIEAALKGETVNLTGFVADKKGLILCTAHYLSNRAAIRVFTKTGQVLSGKLIKIDRKKDLAFIDCNYSFKTEVNILKGLSNLFDSQKVIAFGCAEKNNRQIINGIISGNSRKVDGQVYWQAQMEVRPGDSGGPVFTENGVFAGIIKGGLRGRLDYTYITPLDTVLLFIKERQD
jgi:S1-C subfamily serine protease